MGSRGDIERLDEALASLSREDGALRLRVGQLLEVLGRGAVFDLGFSSLGAYGVERCERSVRWVEAARCLARRVEELPELRRAMAMGKVSWAMGEVLARVATAADELRWLALAESRTVRQVREVAEEALRAARAKRATSARAVELEPPTASRELTADDEVGHWSAGVEGLCTLACTVNREDAWLFEATRCLLDQLGERGADAQVEALLAEGQGTLLASLPRGAIDGGSLQRIDEAQQRWVEQLRRWRSEAEVMCEKNVLGAREAAGTPSHTESFGSLVVAASLGIAPVEHASCILLDGEVRSLASALARRELELSRLLLQFHQADGWRRLGYATEAQYARERLGLSRSSFVARRALALRLETLPRIAAALGAAHIGVEAALQLVRIATPNTEAAWVERASRRTIKHLREEVSAALVAVRLSGDRHCPPPEDPELAAFQTLEQVVVSGRFGESPRPDDVVRSLGSALSGGDGRPLGEPSESQRAWHVMLGSLAAWLEGGLQMSAAPPRWQTTRACSLAGRVTLRLRVSRETFAWWHGLEAQARRWLPRGMSWLRFLCLALWEGGHHGRGTEVAYGHIYVRDRGRCTSPVCNRRDVTPHHIQFRSAGGGDEAQNLTSPCTWCHLHGVHGGRIRVAGTAEQIRWELGPRNAPCVVVNGRERMVQRLGPFASVVEHEQPVVAVAGGEFGEL